jgi:uncharacterized protein YndB with AHSA1/START domain
MVVKNDSNQMVVKREIEIEDVWEAVTDAERWLGDEVDAPDGLEPGSEFVVRDDDGERHGRVEAADPPGRLVWWWWREDEPATRVEVLVVAAPAATRVVVVESLPAAGWAMRLQLLAGAARSLVAA